MNLFGHDSILGDLVEWAQWCPWKTEIVVLLILLLTPFKTAPSVVVFGISDTT